MSTPVQPKKAKKSSGRDMKMLGLAFCILIIAGAVYAYTHDMFGGGKSEQRQAVQATPEEVKQLKDQEAKQTERVNKGQATLGGS